MWLIIRCSLEQASLPPHCTCQMPPQNQYQVDAADDDRNKVLNGVEEITQTVTKPLFKAKWFSDWEGYGCVASEDITRYTLIHIEEPFIKGGQISNALRLHKSGQLKTQLADTEYLRHTCGKSDDEIDRLWQLHDQYQHKYNDEQKQLQHDSSSGTKRLWGIISSNSFEYHEMNFQKRLYLTTSRFNHSCSPNVAYEMVGWTIRLYAIRNIEAGDTLCISYSDVMYHFPSLERKKYLLGALNFDCACNACDMSVDEETRTKSDDNRKRLKKIAIELKHRVDATLYSSEFCVQVKELTNRVSYAFPEQSEVGKEVAEEDKLRKRAELIERVRLRKLSKTIPIGQYDLDLMSEYITLLEEERINFDMLPIYKLAYHISLKVGTASNPPQEYWAEKYLELVKCAKGFDGNTALESLERYQLDDESRPSWL